MIGDISFYIMYYTSRHGARCGDREPRGSRENGIGASQLFNIQC